MKKILLSLLVCIMMFSFAACKKEEKANHKVEEKKITNLAEAYETEIPTYNTSGGLARPVYAEGNGGYQVCIQGTNREEFDAYVSVLEEEGFTIHSKKEISAGSEIADKNVFYTFKGKGIHIYLTWNPGLGFTRMIISPEEILPSAEKPKVESSDTVVPSVTQMQMDGVGMQYVTQLPDGKYIVVDGGEYTMEDMFRLHDFLVDNTPKGQKPTIACWFFTHEHPDHIELSKQFIPKYNGEIELESVAYRFPSEEFVSTDSSNDASAVAKYKELIQIIETYYPDAIHYQLHAGQSYYYKGLEIEILQTTEEFYPNLPTSWNDTSIAFRMKFDSGKTVMFLGDSMKVLCQLLEDTYGDYMKSDVLQLAHHGLLGGYLELYQHIDPDVCFWSTTEDRFNGNDKSHTYKYCLGEGGCDFNAYLRDTSIKKRTHYHNGQMSTLLMN